MRNWLVMMKIAFRVIFIFKMAADKIGKISMFSNFNKNVYLGLFWSEELIGNDENYIQGVIFTMPPFPKWLPTKSPNCQWSPISMKIDIQEYFEVRNWLVPWILIWGSFGDFCVCIQTQSNLVISIIIIIIIILSLLLLAVNLSDQILRDWWSDLY